jgi:four helix bundle protein
MGSEMTQYCNAKDLRIVQVAEELAGELWQIVSKWDWFAKKTVGDQLIRAVDSIGANISEGQGRHHAADNLRFLYISRGSLEEALLWLGKSRARGLLEQGIYESLDKRYSGLALQLNAFIRAKRNNKQKRSFAIHQSNHPSICRSERGGE